MVAQEPSQVAFAELHSALPMSVLEDMLEAFSVGLDAVLDDRDLAGLDRDVVHAHADVSLLLRASQLCHVEHCSIDQGDCADHDHRTRHVDLQDCESGCEQNRG